MDRVITDLQKREDIVFIARQFNIGEVIDITKYGNGRINETFLARTLYGPKEKGNYQKYILQKLHRIFTPAVLEDIDVITNRLEDAGLTTPRLVRTLTGELGYKSGGDCWRMLTYIPGKTYKGGINDQMAENAASLLGKFHDVLVSLDYEFRHKIPNFHDTTAIMERLKKTTTEYKNTEKYRELFPLAKRVLIEYQKIEGSIERLPDRIIHGDPKLNNIRFDEKDQRAISFIDLDTLGRNKIIIDIGDAVRSCCNYTDDRAEKNTRFDSQLFKSMMSGYLSTALFMSKEEIDAVPYGVVMMVLELSARYIADAFEESYFKLDNARYPKLFEQNKEKAIAQLSLYDDFQNKKNSVDCILKGFM